MRIAETTPDSLPAIDEKEVQRWADILNQTMDDTRKYLCLLAEYDHDRNILSSTGD